MYEYIRADEQNEAGVSHKPTRPYPWWKLAVDLAVLAAVATLVLGAFR